MKTIYTVLLNDGVDKHEFIHTITNEKCHCEHECENIPNIAIFSLTDDEAENLKLNENVKEVVKESGSFPTDLPNFYSKTKTFSASLPSINQDGRLYSSMQFYYFTENINSNITVGGHRWSTPPTSDQSSSILATYSSCWTGKNVDIVTLEVDIPKIDNYQNTHPDFLKSDNPLESRFIPTNWPFTITPINSSQTSTTSLLSSHAIGVLSAAAGTICGLAKNSSMRVIYKDLVYPLSVNSVMTWHNSKPINPETGVKNPTILIHEYQFLRNRDILIKIDDIDSVTYFNTVTNSLETISRPGSTWGNDYTIFSLNNFNIKRVIFEGRYYWCIAVVNSVYNPLKEAIDAASAAGVINVVASGNDCGVYVKQTDPAIQTTVTLNSTATVFLGQASLLGSTAVLDITTSTSYGGSTLPTFLSYGPAGSNTAIDVAAGQNSEAQPILDGYSVRGPGIDMVGLGVNTYTSYPSRTLADGNRWGMFSGTSCAAPTVAGILACLLEKYYYYYNVWPTPAQAKELLITESKKDILKITTATTWSSVPSPASNIKGSQLVYSNLDLMLLYQTMGANGGESLNELLGTPNRRAFLNNNIIKKTNSSNATRPSSGMAYPRNNIKFQ